MPNPRRLSPRERTDYLGYFPHLDTASVWVTDSSINTRNYNCIAWSVGSTTSWYNPETTKAAQDAFYLKWGFAPANDGPVLLWMAWERGALRPSHAAAAYPAGNGRWESKCGPGLRLVHDTDDLRGGDYGTPLHRYDRTQDPHLLAIAPVDMMHPLPHLVAIAPVDMMHPLPRLATAERSKLARTVAQIDPSVRKSFEATFAAWQQTWFAGVMAINSDSNARAKGPEFDALVQMGPSILPLVVREMIPQENHFVVHLFDAIVGQDKLRNNLMFVRPLAIERGPPVAQQEVARTSARRWLAQQ